MDFPPASSVLRFVVGPRLVGVIVPDEICCMAAMSVRSLPRISHFPSLPLLGYRPECCDEQLTYSEYTKTFTNTMGARRVHDLLDSFEIPREASVGDWLDPFRI